MYDDTVGAWLTVTRSFQLLYVYCKLLGYESLNVKLSEKDILFLLILNVLDWNMTCMLDGASLFFTFFILCFC